LFVVKSKIAEINWLGGPQAPLPAALQLSRTGERTALQGRDRNLIVECASALVAPWQQKSPLAAGFLLCFSVVHCEIKNCGNELTLWTAGTPACGFAVKKIAEPIDLCGPGVILTAAIKKARSRAGFLQVRFSIRNF